VTKPCPEQSEGTPEIATGFALATTSSDCHALRARNDNSQWVKMVPILCS
jgi:hypothetical protein